jgi:hypothetical protein
MSDAISPLRSAARGILEGPPSSPSNGSSTQSGAVVPLPHTTSWRVTDAEGFPETHGGGDSSLASSRVLLSKGNIRNVARELVAGRPESPIPAWKKNPTVYTGSGSSLADLAASPGPAPPLAKRVQAKLEKLEPKARNKLRVALAYAGDLLDGSRLSDDDALTTLFQLADGKNGPGAYTTADAHVLIASTESSARRSRLSPQRRHGRARGGADRDHDAADDDGGEDDDDKLDDEGGGAGGGRGVEDMRLYYDPSAPIVGGGATPAELDAKIHANVELNMALLHSTAQNLQRELGAMRHQAQVSEQDTKESLLLTRNALPPRFLRENARVLFAQRFFDTLLRLWRSGYFFRWKREVRAQQLLERERLRLLHIQKRKYQAATNIARALSAFEARLQAFRLWSRFYHWKKMTERYRRWLMKKSAENIQRIGRGVLVRKKALQLRMVTRLLQRVARGFHARRQVKRLRGAKRLQRNWRLYWRKKCAAIRMQAHVRAGLGWKKHQQKKYVANKVAAICRGVQFRRHRRKAMRKLRRWWRRMYKMLCRAATKCSAARRAYVCRRNFLRKKAAAVKMQAIVRMGLQVKKFLEEIAIWREENHMSKAMLAAMKRALKANFHFREVRKIAGVAYLVTIKSHDAATLKIEVYNPATCERQEFVLQKAGVFTKEMMRGTRRPSAAAASAGGKPDAEEQVKLYSFYSKLADRLCEKVRAGGQRVIKVRNHGFGSRGRTQITRGARVSEGTEAKVWSTWVIEISEYVGDYVVKAYSPATSETMTASAADYEIAKWLGGKPFHALKPEIMRIGREAELLAWLTNDLFIWVSQADPSDRKLMFRAQLQEKQMATKMQGTWRRLRARRAVRQLALGIYRKDYDRESGMHYYTNTKNGFASWTKPASLGAADVQIEDKWELVKQPDGTMAYYHAATGRWSWLSPDDAARKVQKRFRKSHSADFAIQTNQLARTIHMLRNVGRKYAEDPTSLVAVVNYAVFNHAIARDYARAKELYAEALKLASRNAVANYGLGLLLLGGNFYPRTKMWEKAQEHLQVARVMDDKGTGFKVAEEMFFRWALVEKPKDVKALVNFALVQQCINKNNIQAEIYYRRALNISSGDETAVVNYRDFQRVKDGLYGYA